MPTANGPRTRRRHGSRAAALSAALGLLLVAGLPAEAASLISHGPRTRPWVALTFDDGWGLDRCATIADTLRRRGATATFLINGSVMAQRPARWRAILDGFAVANHGRTHRDMRYLSAAQLRSEIAGDEHTIERILGRPMLHYLRPPYGAVDSEVMRVALGLGYRVLLWDVDSGDTRAGATTGSVLAAATRAGRGSIVLMHCGPSVTPGAVGRIVDRYRARGLELVDLGRMLGYAGVPPPLPPTACRVRNLRTGRTSHRLARAVRDARRGDRLTVSGTCTGSATVRTSISVRGVRIAGSGRPTLDAKLKGRVVSVAPGVELTLRGLLLRRGKSDMGGAIRNAGLLRLRDVAVRDSRARIGGGVDNRPTGRLRLMGSSLIRGNRAAERGGGLRNLGVLVNVDCGPGGNVRGNAPDDCAGPDEPPPSAPPSAAPSDPPGGG
jgi:peptidoglycan/xylan/chitin deacetylase (PgdA/CDA1 family)